MTKSPAHRDAEFLLHRLPYGFASTGCFTVDSTAEKDTGSVYVGVVLMSARRARERCLSNSTCGVDVTALGARLRRVVRRYFQEHTAAPSQLVVEHHSEAAPSRVKNRSVEARLRRHVLSRLFLRSRSRLGHASDVQVLDHDYAVPLSVVRALDVQLVIALPPHLPMDSCDPALRLFPVLRALQLLADLPLSAGEPLQRTSKVLGVFNSAPIAVGDEQVHAPVDSDGWTRRSSCRRLLDRKLADDGSKPSIPVSRQRARLRLSFNRPVHHRAKHTDLREANVSVDDTPRFRVRLAESDVVPTLLLEVRPLCDLLEGPLPRLVQLHENLRTDVTRHVSEPRKFFPEFSQFKLLIEGCVELPAIPNRLQAHKALLVGDVPEETKSVRPSHKTSLLLDCRVDSESESLYHWSMEPDLSLRRGRSVVYSLSAHLVFVPKYRRAVFTERVWDTARSTFEKVCADFEGVLVESSCEPDHVHRLVEYPPKVALSHLVNSLKGVSSRRLRQAEFPEVQNALRGDAFWSPSYCAVSTGGAALEVVKKYVQDQSGPLSLPPLKGQPSRGIR